MDSVLSVKNLTVKLGDHFVIRDISFDVKKGETVAIIGPNGAGKTTLFKAILGLIPFEGQIKWNNQPKIGYVPQRFNAGRDLPITASDFLNLKNTNKQDVSKALEWVGLKNNHGHIRNLEKHILNNRLGELSGGEIQRVIIAWALMDNPQVLLLDEPTAGVDEIGEETIYETLAKLKKEKNLTIMLITHEPEIVKKYATQTINLNHEH